jgi:SAM-dependent methyltransferase
MADNTNPSLMEQIRYFLWKRTPLKRKFSGVYREGGFGGGGPRSGVGSSSEQTEGLRQFLEDLLCRLEVRLFVDAACGDFTWMQAVHFRGTKYMGIDVVPEIVADTAQKYTTPGRTFVLGDLRTIAVPRADLVLCRDCLVHLSFSDGARVLSNLCRSRSKWLLATTFPSLRENRDIVTGTWRPINLAVAPYAMGAPIELFSENPQSGTVEERDKCLGLWQLAAD